MSSPGSSVSAADTAAYVYHLPAADGTLSHRTLPYPSYQVPIDGVSRTIRAVFRVGLVAPEALCPSATFASTSDSDDQSHQISPLEIDRAAFHTEDSNGHPWRWLMPRGQMSGEHALLGHTIAGMEGRYSPTGDLDADEAFANIGEEHEATERDDNGIAGQAIYAAQTVPDRQDLSTGVRSLDDYIQQRSLRRLRSTISNDSSYSYLTEPCESDGEASGADDENVDDPAEAHDQIVDSDGKVADCAEYGVGVDGPETLQQTKTRTW